MLATHSLISCIGPCQPRRSPLTYIVANRFEQIMCVSVCCSFPNRRCDDSVPGSIACWSTWSASWTHWAQSWKHRSAICSSRVNPYTTRFLDSQSCSSFAGHWWRQHSQLRTDSPCRLLRSQGRLSPRWIG